MVGVTSTHFEKIRDVMGATVLTIYNNTETKDPITGDRTDSLGSGTSVNGIFLRREQMIKAIEVGKIEDGDAYALVPVGTTISEGDRVTANSENFLVEDVITRYWGAETVYIHCRLSFEGDGS